MTSAKKTDPELWEEVKKQVTKSDKGGEPGQWSARKAQMAVQEYKKKGGGYDEKTGAKQKDTHLHAWTEEEWGTKSGEQSGESGERYLPKKVRMVLTEDEYRRSTRKKKSDTKGKGEQFSGQPKDVAEKANHIKKRGPTKKMLGKRAKELGISGSTNMGKDELLKAIDKATDGQGRAKSGGGGDGESGGKKAQLKDKSKSELYEMAKKRDLDGRSSMSKDELARALSA